MTDTIAGIPVEVLPPKVQAGLRTHLTLQMAVSADAIRSVFGGREEHVVRQLSARSGAQVQLWPVPADAIDRRVSMVGTIRELLEAHRLLHVALNGGEPERLTAKLLLAAHLAGLVIGKSAETVREISRQSGASVVVEKQMAAVSGGKLEERLTRVSGAMAQVSNALAQILLMLIDNSEAEAPPPPAAAAAADAEYDPANPSIGAAPLGGGGGGGGFAGGGGGGGGFGGRFNGGGGGYGGGGGGSSAADLARAEVGVELLVSSSAAGAIIGRKGATVNGVASSSGAKVFVRKEPLPGGERCVVVRGRLSQVEAAERQVSEILDEAARKGTLSHAENRAVATPDGRRTTLLVYLVERAARAAQPRAAAALSASGGTCEVNANAQRPSSPLPHAAALPAHALIGCVLCAPLRALLDAQRILFAEQLGLAPPGGLAPPPQQQQPPPSALGKRRAPADWGAWGAEPDAARARAAPPPPHLPQPVPLGPPPAAVVAAAQHAAANAAGTPIPAEGWPPGLGPSPAAAAAGDALGMALGLGPGACSGGINAAAPKGHREPPPSEAPRLRVLVPHKAAGGVIGRGGHILQDVRHRTGCHVDMQPTAPDAPEGGDRLALLSGSGRSQLHALQEMWRHVESTMRYLNAPIPPVRFLVPGEAVDAIVGVGGRGIQEINGASGASVSVSPQPLGGPGASPYVMGTRIVTAQGTLESAVAAARMVLERAYGH